MAPTLSHCVWTLPPEGALRLRSGEASPAAPAGEDANPHGGYFFIRSS